MMILSRSSRFKRAYKRLKRSGRKDVLHVLIDVFALLRSYDDRAQFVLRERYRDHQLIGDKKGIRELHLAKDDLLLYFVVTEHRTINLVDIVSHEILRKKK